MNARGKLLVLCIVTECKMHTSLECFIPKKCLNQKWNGPEMRWWLSSRKIVLFFQCFVFCVNHPIKGVTQSRDAKAHISKLTQELLSDCRSVNCHNQPLSIIFSNSIPVPIWLSHLWLNLAADLKTCGDIGLVSKCNFAYWYSFQIPHPKLDCQLTAENAPRPFICFMETSHS